MSKKSKQNKAKRSTQNTVGNLEINKNGFQTEADAQNGKSSGKNCR